MLDGRLRRKRRKLCRAILKEMMMVNLMLIWLSNFWNSQYKCSPQIPPNFKQQPLDLMLFLDKQTEEIRLQLR